MTAARRIIDASRLARGTCETSVGPSPCGEPATVAFIAGKGCLDVLLCPRHADMSWRASEREVRSGWLRLVPLGDLR